MGRMQDHVMAATANEVAAIRTAKDKRLIALLNKYGFAKFGDEWWPGNPRPWLDEAEAAELIALLVEQ